MSVELIPCVACLAVSAAILIYVFFVALRLDRALRHIAREEANAALAPYLAHIAKNDMAPLAQRAAFAAALFNRSLERSL